MAKTPKNSHSEERVMESILGKSTKDGKTLYRVKWKGLSLDEATWEPESNVKLSFIKKYEESISKGIPFSETKDYNVDEEKPKKAKKDKPVAVDEYGFNKYGPKYIWVKQGDDPQRIIDKINEEILEKAKTATTPIPRFVLSTNQRPRSTGQIRVLKTINSQRRQSTGIRKRKLNESINCHLDRVMKSAKKGTRYSEANILGVLGAQYNLMREKYYLVQLTSKNVVPIHPDDIPLKFRDECSRIDGDALFGF
uniref:Chromo domain-containing protein n=1 Tax=Strongyloides venezuelensis TaxID=75913 RepID=A0A0K0G332_STRVS